ncbi:MAG: hypothetical protein ABS46_04780 [Cytophagaceae bacterium SCN 52-12]|nr:MAG: hypothetical protein ABS46_04780 [Cytophagaceae bacterium SCN 52-12]
MADLHFFDFTDFDLGNWSYNQLLRFLPPELSSLTRRGHKTEIAEARVNEALLSIASAASSALVTVRQEDRRLHIGCSCGGISGKLCVFQVQAVLNLLENQELRIFFDSGKREQQFRITGEKYGFRDIDDLEKEFELVWDGRPVVKPRNEHLQACDDENLHLLASELTPPKPVLPEWNEDAVKILVWTQSRFQDNFQLGIFEAFTTAGGNLRGPVRPVHAVDLLLEAETTDHLKFYGAVAKFQDQHRSAGQVTDRQAFYWLLKNPDRLPVYIHNFGISESIVPQALRLVEMVSKEMEMSLTVHDAGEFFEVKGVLTIEGKSFDLLETRLRCGNFLLAGNRLHLIERDGFKELLEYLQRHRNKIVLHRSRYEAFRKEVLERVENYTRVTYTYLKTAGKKQKKELGLDYPPRKILYLDDAGQYVHLTPVVQYGHVELPVLSPRVLYMVDHEGRPFKVERENRTEMEFATSLMLSHPGFAEQAGQDYVYLHKLKFLDEDWFLKTFQEWRNQGIRILGFNRIQNNRLNEYQAKVTVTVVSGIDWFETKAEVRFGEEVVPLRQLFTSVRNKSRYIPLADGTTGILPQEWLEKLAGYFRIGSVHGETVRTLRQHFGELRDLYPEAYLSPSARADIQLLADTLGNLDEIPAVQLPGGFRGVLRDYQYEGVKWLAFMGDLGFGACLADDMGLGKTIQVIAYLLICKKRLPGSTSLVVVPASLLFNWQTEIARYAPDLRFAAYYGEGRKMDFPGQQEFDVILTTYSVMVAEIHRLRLNEYHCVVLDESQNIKNPSSQRYRAACQLRARHRIILTGTPVENNTYDLYGQFSFACPGLLGSRRYFKDHYFMPVDKFHESGKIEELQARIRPFMLRRTKEQVAKQLPEKTEMVIYCEMGPEQRRVYDAYAEEFRHYLAGKSDGDIAREKLHVLQGLTKLRQICISPLILNDEEYYGGESAKITVLMEQLESLAAHHKILVFSQFVTVLDLVREELGTRSIGYSYLVGATVNRGEVVRDFQESEEKRVFLISLKAGGTGLNLTAASYVFLIDPWWNPAVESQAVDRVHRIGQDKTVIAIRLVCPGTIEERVIQLQQNKKELTGELIRSEESIGKELDKKALLQLV